MEPLFRLTQLYQFILFLKLIQYKMSAVDAGSKTKANTLSVKLLSTIGGSFEGPSGKNGISNLKDLSQRIKMANEQLSHQTAKKYETE